MNEKLSEKEKSKLKIKYDKYIKSKEIITIVKDILNKDSNKYQELKDLLIKFK